MCLNSTTENQTQDNIPDIAPQISHRSKFFTTDAEDNQTMHVKVEIQDGDFGNNENTSHSSVLENFQVRNHDDGTSQNVFSENHGVDKRYTGKTLQNVNKSQAQYIKTEIVDESLSPPQVGVVMENLEDGSYQYPGIISHNLTQHIKEEFPDEETMEVENHNERDYIVSNSEEMDMMNVQDAGGEITHSDRNYAQNDDETLKMEIHDDRTDTDNDETDMDNVRWQPGDKVQVVRVSKDVFPAGQSPSTDASSSKPCQICGGISDGVHFGVTSCIPCKTVFATTGIYKCAGEKRCDLTRNGCKYCLIEKCVAVGMSMHASDKKDSKKRTETLFLPGTRSHPSRSSFPGQQKVSVHVSRGDATQPPTKRFRSVTEEELMRNETSPQSKSTYRNTQWGLRIFQAWSVESNGRELDMSTITAGELNEMLSRFYCEARPKNVEKRTENLPSQQAEVYHKNTLINIRGAINRRLTDLGRDIDLVKDKEFKPSNRIMTGLLKQRMRDGSSRPTQHKQIINEMDLSKISTYLSTAPSSAVVLRQCVWYYIAIHFVTRGLEFHKQLRINSFNFLSDEHGEYALLNHETQQKNYQGGTSYSDAPEKRMYATGGPNCPVEMLKLFIEKTDTQATMLFNRYVKYAKPSDKWFTDKPLASRTYSNFMSDICTAAQLSTKYTAHCLRATAIEALNNHGFEARHIMFMSGHKSEAAIRSYNRSYTSQQRQALSKTLSSVACTSGPRVDSCRSEPPALL
ncbi:uncharacterized protein LOC117315013 isoform X2 [Pecten maximus]|uniref:uncharacterized protein LOC117315013 isoform X2 n=1 Tax=Pecten maximus TaxID=6579 RepID=UPI00145904C1|nr:uncharacterized protein LOC117315013 isoform X2 [Pecten maximus]